MENCYAYDAFGNTLEKKEGIQNHIQYTGQQYDQETGQYYLRARYYNPTVGRFTQEDTYRGDGLNLYAYCKNNPVVYYDPSGHDQLVNPSNGTEMTNTAGVEKGNSSIDNKGGSEALSTFETEEKLLSHFDKHKDEFKGIFGSVDEYLQGAQDVMQNGYKVEYIYKGEIRTGYVQFMGNSSKGQAKFAFVGTNNQGYITTFHTESGKSFWKMLNEVNVPVINPI